MNQIPEPAAQSNFDTLVKRLPLLWASLALLAGVLAAKSIVLPAKAWLLAACLSTLFALLVLGVFFRLNRQILRLQPATWLIISVAMTAFFLGGARYQSLQPRIDANHIAWYNDRDYDLLVTGTIAAGPDVRDTYTNLRIKVTAVDTGDGDLAVEGLLLARVDNQEDYRYGEIIRLRGQLSTPPENDEFSYRDYLSRQGIHSLLTSAEVTRLPFPREGNALLRWVYDFKDRAVENLYKIFRDPEASLLAGILLGVDKGLSADLQQAFKDTGTSHIIAISGFNVAIIASLFMLVFGRLFGKRRGPWLAIGAIALYTLLVGAEASVVRAAIMGGLGLLAHQVGRRQTAIHTLAFTGAVMCFINPNMPWDVGFQLSFLATLGLILYGEALREWAERVIGRFALPDTAAKIAKPITEFFLLTLAAQVTTLPIMAWHFGRISPVSLIANPFILPVQPLVMILSGTALLLSLIYLPLGQLFAWAALPFSAYTIRLVEFFSQFPNAVLILGDFSFLIVLIIYLILFLWTFSKGWLKTGLRTAATPSIILAVLVIFTYLAWSSVLTHPDGKLHITFLNVGSADAILIETPTGRNVLINGGASAATLSEGLGRRLSPLRRSIDWVIIASPQEEQISALPTVLERFPSDQILWAGNPEASYSALRIDDWATTNQIPSILAQKGYSLDLGMGARLDILSVTPRGAVLLVTWGEIRTLLPVGLNFDSLEELDYGEQIGEVDILLLADSGFEPLNRGDWIANLNPQAFILNVAADDKAGLPDEKVLELTQDRTLLRTDQNGWIEIISSDEELFIEVEKK